MTIARNRRNAAVVEAALKTLKGDYLKQMFDDYVLFCGTVESEHKEIEEYQVVFKVDDDAVSIYMPFPRKTDAAHYLNVVDFLNRIYGWDLKRRPFVEPDTFEVVEWVFADVEDFGKGFKDWLGKYVGPTIVFYERYAPGLLAVMEDRMSAEEASRMCTADLQSMIPTGPDSGVVGSRWVHFPRPR